MSDDVATEDGPAEEADAFSSSRIEQTSGLGTLATLRRGLELSPEIRQRYVLQVQVWMRPGQS